MFERFAEVAAYSGWIDDKEDEGADKLSLDIQGLQLVLEKHKDAKTTTIIIPDLEKSTTINASEAPLYMFIKEYIKEIDYETLRIYYSLLIIGGYYHITMTVQFIEENNIEIKAVLVDLSYNLVYEYLLRIGLSIPTAIDQIKVIQNENRIIRTKYRVLN
jgi:hypothetical protein